jgi:peptidoglycan/LPS O-acetylase OafA/YrhL
MAAASVIGCHLRIPGLSFGWIGVQLFFILSGFLITGILLRIKSSTGFYSNFYVRRAVRILPIYFILLSLVISVGMARHWPVSDWPWFALFADNWLLGLIGPTQVAFPPFLEHLWTLAVEEQFYFLWPIAVGLLPRRLSIALITALIVSGPVFRWRFEPHTFDSSWIFSYDFLAWGAAGAIFIRYTVKIDRILLTICILFLTLLAVLVSANQLIFHDLLAPLFISILIYVHGGNSPLVSALEWPLLRYIGRISYGLYIYHLPAFYLCGTILHKLLVHFDGATTIVVNIALTIGIAALSYRFIERPLLRRRGRAASQTPPLQGLGDRAVAPSGDD